MTNLSELTRQASGHAAPGWIDILNHSGEFIEGAAWPSQRTTPDKQAPQQDAIARAFADGEAAGRAAAEAEYAQAAGHHQALRLNLASLDKAASEILEQELAQTVLSLCQTILGDYAVDPQSLAQRCTLAAASFAGAATMLQLHLHPDDIALLDDAMRNEWKIVPDPTLERGALRLEDGDGAVSDGPAEWSQVIQRALRP